MGTEYTAIVHGGNAVVRKRDKHWGEGIVVRGEFLAGPEGDSLPNTYIGSQHMFAHMHFVIFADPLVECPPGRGCSGGMTVVDPP